MRDTLSEDKRNVNVVSNFFLEGTKSKLLLQTMNVMIF